MLWVVPIMRSCWEANNPIREFFPNLKSKIHLWKKDDGVKKQKRIKPQRWWGWHRHLSKALPRLEHSRQPGSAWKCLRQGSLLAKRFWAEWKWGSLRDEPSPSKEAVWGFRPTAPQWTPRWCCLPQPWSVWRWERRRWWWCWWRRWWWQWRRRTRWGWPSTPGLELKRRCWQWKEGEDLVVLQEPGQDGCSTGGKVEQGGVPLCLSQSPLLCPQSSALNLGDAPTAPDGQNIW